MNLPQGVVTLSLAPLLAGSAVAVTAHARVRSGAGADGTHEAIAITESGDLRGAEVPNERRAFNELVHDPAVGVHEIGVPARGARALRSAGLLAAAAGVAGLVTGLAWMATARPPSSHHRTTPDQAPSTSGGGSGPFGGSYQAQRRTQPPSTTSD